MNTDRTFVATVEEVAANSWPAAVVEMLDGWRLRATPGVDVRRSNSVLPNGGSGGVPVEDKLAAVETFAERHGTQPRYQVSDAAVPGDLDELLAGRGYEIEMAVHVMVADLAEVDQRAGAAAADVVVEPEPSDRWLDAMLGITARGERGTFRGAILDRIDRPVRYASVVVDDEAVATGMGVVDGDWLGIFTMATRPEARRRGFATSVLRGLARSGIRLGASRAYLQTEQTNAASHALYEGLGFETAYGYHYRTRRPAGP